MKLKLGVITEETHAIQLLDENGEIVAWVSGLDVRAQWNKDESLNHANLIIQSVNFHDELVEKLKSLLIVIDGYRISLGLSKGRTNSFEQEASLLLNKIKESV